MKYFLIEDSSYKKDKCFIKVNFAYLPKECFIKEQGSFNVLPARFLGISYADYCRLCRDEFGAILIGKHSLYPIPYFKNHSDAEKLINLLEGNVRF